MTRQFSLHYPDRPSLDFQRDTTYRLAIQIHMRCGTRERAERLFGELRDLPRPPDPAFVEATRDLLR